MTENKKGGGLLTETTTQEETYPSTGKDTTFLTDRAALAHLRELWMQQSLRKHPTAYGSFSIGITKHFPKMSSQLKTTEILFSGQPKTMLQVARLSNIERSSICRYVSTLKKYDRLELKHFGLCPITNHRAGFYLTIENEEG
jgi:hypothetical protein